jgi:hypothetical protein
MNIVRRLLDPFWRLLGQHPWLSAAISAVATLGGALAHFHWVTLIFGMAAGSILMFQAEKLKPAPVRAVPPA